MEIRRDTFGAAVRLAVVLSTIAAVLTLGIDAVGDVSTTAMVSTVAVIGFVSSWVLTGRVARSVPVERHHRVTVVRIHQPVG